MKQSLNLCNSFVYPPFVKSKHSKYSSINYTELQVDKANVTRIRRDEVVCVGVYDVEENKRYYKKMLGHHAFTIAANKPSQYNEW